VSVVVIGGGQAGLAVSHELWALGLEHVVLERNSVAETWRGRWDSFCLVTPNWFIRLPGGGYDGPEPDAFMARDDVVAHLERYAASLRAPVHEGVEVTAVEPGRAGGLLLRTNTGDLLADKVVVATGTYRTPHRPAAAASLPLSLFTIDAEAYRNPQELPEGAALVVGSGQTGCQLAEELYDAGREVVLACGRAPWAPRRIEGRDLVAWLVETPFLEQKVADLPSPQARLIANVQTSGHGGGHDLHYRVLQAQGVRLAGHFRGVENGWVQFAPDLAQSVAFGDDRYRDVRRLLRTSCEARGLPAPELADPEPFKADPPEQMELDRFGAVIFTAGFRPDYASWIKFPGCFDELGFPIQVNGASSAVPGLYFLGTHFLRTRKSSLLAGVGEDATIVAEAVANS
jgi:putative flavoprotein involved in K+ transport